MQKPDALTCSNPFNLFLPASVREPSRVSEASPADGEFTIYVRMQREIANAH